MTHVAASIGIPEEADARALSRALVDERVAAGTRISSGVSHYRWDGTVRERTYWTVVAFTTEERLDDLYALVGEYTDDDLPGVTYTEIGARDEYLQWIEAQTG